MKELYHEEQKILSDYLEKVKKKDINMEDAVGIAMNYKDLLDQSKVMTSVSDRLQKKLDRAGQKIKKQNTEIQTKNTELEVTIDQLDQMTMGKKATRIMFVLFIGLFISEQLFLEPIIDSYIDIPYLGIAIMLLIATSLKLFESRLEANFMKQKKRKILNSDQSNDAKADQESKNDLSFLRSKRTRNNGIS